MTQIPLFNKMKRKRGDSSPDSPRLGSPQPKKRTETMSHVEIPASDVPRAGFQMQGKQVNEVPLNQLGEIANQRPNEMVWERTPEINAPQNLPQRETPNNNRTDIRKFETKHSKALISSRILRESIESQFGLEILLKHKELRLIDQEFAKCQTALEQLRRCQVVPYPAMSSDFENMQAVISGSGPVFHNRARHAPPWGVSNGPYSRHYERWLIPDSVFDEGVDTMQTQRAGGKTLPDRATRGSKGEKGSLASKSRSQRGSNSARLKALPHGYPEPKEEKGPMIVKRSSDGRMVKLVCLDCRRSNFNSAQGFINHCRIAHTRQFLSHDAAIEASGEEIDMDAEGGLGEVNGPQGTASVGLVHPLIREAAHLARASPITPSISSPSSRRRKSHSAAASNNPPMTDQKNASLVSTPRQPSHTFSHTTAPFNPSPQTPHLSALMAKLGRGGDLDELVIEARKRPGIDLTLSSDEEDDQVEEDAPEETDAFQSHSTRGVLRGGEISCRLTRSPPSEQTPTHPGFSNASRKPEYLRNIHGHPTYPSPYRPDDHHDQEDHDTPMLDHNTPLNLSPNTIESHTAPSLVSDDGDYENTHSESEAPSSAEPDDEEDHYIHAEVIDHDDMDLGEGSSAAPDHHLAFAGKPHGPATGRRLSAMRPPTGIRDEASDERHVSFAPPGRRNRRGSKANDGQ
ncbi:hypothetical protein MMC28_005318 [Mycoblastus sanguinarius]|nr:hypothetical protein [Mycoblastus sanguinarius]